VSAVSIYTYIAVFCVFVFFITYYITSYVRNYSLRNNVVDRPNERSSHFIPTPTGGGLAISLSILLSIFILSGLSSDAVSLSIALGSGVFLIGIIGWFDIHKEVPVLIRAVLYLVTSVWAVWLLGGVNPFSIGGFNITSYWVSSFISVFWIAWLVNLYNFMDGTDGLAGVQALSTALFGALFFISSGHILASIICVTIVSSISGFLVWNWAPAKIFMGDVGSCSLGFTFAVLAVYGQITSSVSLEVWLILLSIFIADASFTLIKRMFTGETWYRAHNTHAYQRLVQMGLSHGKLALYVLIINILILGPIAYFVWQNPEYSMLCLFAVYFTLAIAWLVVHRIYPRQISTH
jgi:glycosyltransferase WbpL